MDEDKYMPQRRLYRTKIVMKSHTTGEYVLLESGQKLLYGLKRKTCDDFGNCIIYKELTVSDLSSDHTGYILELTTEETDLPLGTYYFDVALQRADGEKIPVVRCKEIQVTRSVV